MLLNKSRACFDKLSMSGNLLFISNFSPFVLSQSKDSSRNFNNLRRIEFNILRKLGGKK